MIDPREKRWQRLLETSATFELRSIRILESNVFASQLIEIPRVLALVGMHGAGKILLLRTIEASFGYTSGGELPPFFADRPLGISIPEPPPIEGVVEMTLATPNGIVSHRVDLSMPPEKRAEIWKKDLPDSFDALYADPLNALNSLAATNQEYFLVVQKVESSVARELSASELATFRSILNRNYEHIAVHSIDLTHRDDPNYIVPYFTATISGKRIDSTAMSFGELWIHYILNWFFDVRLNDGDVALLDEPEAFLAARAQRPFIDEVARRALIKGSQLIIGTHAPEVLARFPLDNIRMCILDRSKIRVIRPVSFVQIRDNIGIDTPVRALILVEDHLAARLLGALFARYDVALSKEAEIIAVGGESEVRTGMRIMKSSNRIRVLGVLDGDQRAPADNPTDHLDSNAILFLPGTTAPETELLSNAIKNVLWIARTLHLSVEDIAAAISSCYTLDHQYQLEAFASQLGQTEPALVFVLVQAWLRDPSIKKMAEKLVKDVRSRISA